MIPAPSAENTGVTTETTVLPVAGSRYGSDMTVALLESTEWYHFVLFKSAFTVPPVDSRYLSVFASAIHTWITMDSDILSNAPLSSLRMISLSSYTSISSGRDTESK